MASFTWIRHRRGNRISAYLDGELDESQCAVLGEHLVFEEGVREELRGLAAVDRLVCAALAPGQRPDPALLAARLRRHCVASEPARPRPRRRHLVAPAVAASVGLLLTAGVAFLRLRRRGVV